MRRSARLNLNGDAGPAGAAIHTFLCRRPSREEGAWGPGPGQLQPGEGEGGRAPPRGSRRSGVCGQRSRAAAGRAPGRGATTLPGPTSSLTAAPPVAAASWKRPSWPSPRGHPPVAATPWPLLPTSLCGSHFTVKLLEREPGSLPAARHQGHPDGQIWGQHSSRSEHRLRSQTRLN